MMLKDKKISILGIVETENELGETEQSFIPIVGGDNIWAHYRHSSGMEYFQAMQVQARVEAVFTINWRDDLNTAMRILYKNKQYNITRIDDYEGYKKDLKIYAYAD